MAHGWGEFDGVDWSDHDGARPIKRAPIRNVAAAKTIV
jgi:hypothetical protein